MEKIKLTKSGHSIDFFAKILVLLLILIMGINLFLSYLSLTTIKKQNLNHISNTINIFAGSLSKELVAVDRFMYWSVLHDETIDALNNSENTQNYKEALDKTRIRFNDFKYYNRVDYTFLIQNKEKGIFTNASQTYIPYSDYLFLKKFFNEEKQQETTAADAWLPIQIGKNDYMYKTVIYENKALHAVVSSEDLLKPLRQIDIGKKGTLSLIENKETSAKLNAPFSNQHLLVAKKNQTNLPFNLYITVDYQGAFRNMVALQLVMLLIPLFICICSLVLLIYIQKKVIRPVKRLTVRLSQASEGQPVLFNEEGVIEIDHANDQISHMVKEMQTLRINVYEAELKQKRIEMNHLRNQIRPHFYLNILTMIHSMMQTQHYHEIEQLTLSTSNYFRYLFQTNQDFISLKGELNHIHDYLDIQKLRYGDSFQFNLKVNPQLENVLIPPLILQTFIENIFKHCFSVDTNLVISMEIDYAPDSLEFYRIIIEDNGPGFLEEELSKLRARVSLVTEEGKHVGLTNTFERLDLLYSENYQLLLSNRLDQGASIHLILPIELA
ncbi:sensor histidine kinase [Enterococcus pallens]|uniref:Signal transduction histidine kinase internal region domain-containing protein n=1 Tax=Enterococcus pallens ATCC BAA-351 TaxID=1158607 RepID=R2SY18_9ENTE|nr:histidine kinase [Enterococcus pallens]EOH97676.1 hypothetical protein UAU_00344 [Enterococcus pallens ATCC BAA-351]EOU20905.1 hypothetical protein I588_01752 [Enterococcus pallens ATCC BAA-351]